MVLLIGDERGIIAHCALTTAEMRRFRQGNNDLLCGIVKASVAFPQGYVRERR
ncbi:hypothetical protein HMPREF9056_01846 [Actinomyces sp. oral taxon 170 str. F0386]|nr:hypothetical protein HMPREF9056_01846 [Actinomyces sp. oral taxon 170 str. F0386]